MTFLLFCSLLLTETGLTPTTLSAEIDTILTEPQFIGGFWGVMVYAPLRKKVLLERNPMGNFRPASNAKILTALMAFEYLGPNYRFDTEIGYTGSISEGVLHGDLVVFGWGDPSFSGNYEPGIHTRDYLASVASAVRAHGIRRIEGDLVGVADMFDEVAIPKSWEWDDVGQDYCVPITPLSLHDGWIEINLMADANGNISREVFPAWTPDLRLNVEATSKPGRSKLKYDRPWGTNHFTISGNLAPCDSVRLTPAAWNPTLQFLASLKGFLNDAGVPVAGAFRKGARPERTHPIHVTTSATVSELSKILMKESQNHYSDLFFKTMGYHYRGEGSFSAGISLAWDLIESIIPKPETMRGFSLRDGSGMSAQNYLNPQLISALLDYGLRQPWREAWLATFPIMGVDGTLEERGLFDPSLQRRVWAKTGYIYRTRNLSGYTETLAGEPLVFVLLANNYSTATKNVEHAQDRICAILRRLEPSNEVRDQQDKLFGLSKTFDAIAE